MKAAALTMSGIDLTSPGRYQDELEKHLTFLKADIAVLPAYSSFNLWINLVGKARAPYASSYSSYLQDSSPWENDFLELHSKIARKTKTYLVAGTAKETEGNCLYHTGYCFNPDGEICCSQRQTHVNAYQDKNGFSRGEKLSVFQVGSVSAGLIIDNDCRHPETGRILVCSGADVLIHCGALISHEGYYRQIAGCWAQVQQNQCWAIEAQLQLALDDYIFNGFSAVLAPCEITEDLSGFLSRSNPGDLSVTGTIVPGDLLKIRSKYPLLKLLNRKVYGEMIDLYKN